MNQTVLTHHGIPGQKGVFKSGKVAYKKENLIRGGD